MKPVRVSLGLLALTLNSIALVTGCNEIQDRHFANVAEARREQMIEKGWVPTVTPEDAKDIRFRGDLDAGSAHGRFESRSLAEVRSHCSVAQDSARIPETVPDWFPDAVKNARTIGELRSSGYEVLICDAGQWTVAIPGQEQRVFYWNIPKR